jgi:hypothetical protein
MHLLNSRTCADQNRPDYVSAISLHISWRGRSINHARCTVCLVPWQQFLSVAYWSLGSTSKRQTTHYSTGVEVPLSHVPLTCDESPPTSVGMVPPPHTRIEKKASFLPITSLLANICTYIHTCMHTYIHPCIHTYTHPVHIYLYTSSYVHACIHIHTYIHTYIHTATVHTYIHTNLHTNKTNENPGGQLSDKQTRPQPQQPNPTQHRGST